MTSPPGPRLSEETAREIFDRQIVPILLADARGHSAPRITLAVGQPGSGLQEFTTRAAAEDNGPGRSGPTVVPVHILATVFPGYRQLRRELGELGATVHVRADVHRWLAMSIAYLRQRRAAIIVEDSDPSAHSARVVLDAATGGARPYPLDVAVLAVPAAQSRLDLWANYQYSVENSGRVTVPDELLHSRALTGVGDVADWAEHQSAIASTTIYTSPTTAVAVRHHATGHTWTAPDPRWPRPAHTMSLTALVETTRSQRWSLQQSMAWVRVHASLTARSDPAAGIPLTALAEQAQPYLDPDTGTRLPLTAMTFGHYPVITTSDLDVVIDMLSRYDRAIIAVLDPRGTAPVVAGHPDAAFLADRDLAAARAATMLTPAEQLSMWEHTLHAAGLHDRVELTVITRPELDPATFHQRFPSPAVQLVLPPPPHGLDPALHPHTGYSRLLGRRVHTAEPIGPQRSLYGIRLTYEHSDPNWALCLAPGSRNLFHALDGPTRVLHPDATARAEHAAWQAATLIPDPYPGTPTASGARIGEAITSALTGPATAPAPHAPPPPAPAPQPGPDAGPGL